MTGAPASEQEYRALHPRGRAFLHAADFHHVVRACEPETATQMEWARSRIGEAAPQALVVA